MKAEFSSETFVPICENKWLYIPEDYNLNINGLKNLIS